MYGELLGIPAFSKGQKDVIISFLTPNVLWYGVVQDYETKTYQFTPTLFTSHKRSQTSETSMHYTMCCAYIAFYQCFILSKSSDIPYI